MFNRIILKLSGEALALKSEKNDYNDKMIDNIISQIKQIIEKGTEVSLVVGGGNLWRGRSARPDMDTVKADNMGMLATVINALYLSEACKRQGVQAKVATPIPIGNMTMLYEKDTALEMMANKTILINAAGLGHPCFSTDTITALRAAELNADCILFAKSVDGVYESDPRKNGNAKKYRQLNYSFAIANDLNAADIAAMHLAKEAGIPSFIFGLDKPNSILSACAYPETGSLEGTYINNNLKEDFYVSHN